MSDTQKFIIKFISFLLALFIIFNCNSIYNVIFPTTLISKIEIPVLLILSIIYIFTLWISKIKLNNQTIFYISILIIYLLIYLVLQTNPISIKSGRTQLFEILLICLVINLSNRIQTFPLILKYYINLMFFIAVISIFFWLLGSVFHIIFPNKMVISTWGNENKQIPSYYNIYFETQRTLTGVTRNTAIFAEAPMAALNFILSLCMEVLFINNDRFRKTKILSLTIASLTTISTAAYIGILILFAYLIINKKINNNSLRYLKNMLVIIIIPILIYIIKLLFSQKLATGSGLDRSSDFLNMFKAWSYRPIFGWGIWSHQNILNSMPIQFSNFGFSSTFTRILGENGIYIFALFILAICRSIYLAILNTDWNRIVFTVLLTYLFVVLIFAETYLLYYLFIWICIWNPYNSQNEIN